MMRAALRIRHVAARACESGFTLLELMVVIMLLGIIAVALFGGLRFSGRVWERTVEIADMADTVEAAQTFLRRELAQAVFVTSGGRAVQGGPTLVAFDAPVQPVHGVGGIFTFVVWLDAARPDRRLQVAWAPARPNLQLEEIMRREPLTLLDDVETFQVRYLASGANGIAPSWVETWDSEALPRAVE